MMFLTHLRLLAQYNQWMNQKVYAAAAQLPTEELAVDRGAFFRSISGTLNHIYVADIIWLQRFATHPRNYAVLIPITQLERPEFLDKIPYADFLELSQARANLDQTILDWTQEVQAADLEYILPYCNMQGVAQAKPVGSLMLHLFNHQTHHRGQVATLLSQLGLDVGVTDLLALI